MKICGVNDSENYFICKFIYKVNWIVWRIVIYATIIAKKYYLFLQLEHPHSS